MKPFLEQHGDRIVGTISGLDRVLFRGTLRSICYSKGMDRFLGAHRVLYRVFDKFAEDLTGRIVDHARRLAKSKKRPFTYLYSSDVDKEALANHIANRDRVREGLICVLRCVEPCHSYEINRNANTKQIDLVLVPRKCLHLYFYYMDREFGLMHIRLQTWLPFSIHVCLNGREYPARQPSRRPANARRSHHAQVGTILEGAGRWGQSSTRPRLRPESADLLLDDRRIRIRHRRDVQQRCGPRR